MNVTLQPYLQPLKLNLNNFLILKAITTCAKKGLARKIIIEGGADLDLGLSLFCLQREFVLEFVTWADI